MSDQQVCDSEEECSQVEIAGASSLPLSRLAEGWIDDRNANRRVPVRPKPIRVLLLAEACNPGWSSVPLVGYNQARALMERKDLEVTLVTHERNRENLVRDDIMKLAHEVVFIDSDAIARPLHLLGQVLRGGKSLGWTTNMALALPGYLYFERLVWKRFRRELTSGGFDVVHRVTPVSPTMPSPLAKWSRVPMVIGPVNGGLAWPEEHPEIRSGEREWFSPARRLYRRMPYQQAMRRRAAALVAGSRSTAAEMREISDDGLYYLPENGFDMNLTNETHKTLGKTDPNPAEAPRLISVARLVPYKALDIALEALAACQDAWSVWTIVGEGPMRAPLEKRVEELGLAGRVNFTGWVTQTEVVRQLTDHEVLVQPSLREFGGGAVLEAMACGTVPLIVDYGGPAELVADGCGFKLPMAGREELERSLAAALRQIAANRETLAEMSQRARAHVEENLTWHAKTDWFVGLYKIVMRQKKASLIPLMSQRQIRTAR